jgi:hypothetical protein
LSPVKGSWPLVALRLENALDGVVWALPVVAPVEPVLPEPLAPRTAELGAVAVGLVPEPGD